MIECVVSDGLVAVSKGMLFFKRLPALLLKYRTLSVILFFTVVIVTFVVQEISDVCIFNDSKKFTTDLCYMYSVGKITGNLCGPLCQDHTISDLTCAGKKTRKKIIFTGSWKKRPLVFKLVNKIKGANHDERNIVDEAQFLRRVHDIVAKTINLTLTQEQLKKFLPSVPINFENRQQAYQDMLQLMTSREFVLGKLFEDKDVFPQIIGNCGTLFAVEFVPNEIFNDEEHDWVNKLKFAINIMDLIEELESSFPDPLQICDMKLNHFGKDAMGRLKYLDGDYIHTNITLQQLISEKKCKNDNDCDIFDCKINCNDQNQKCDRGQANNNFQILCEKLFVGWSAPGKIIVPGLLISEFTPTSLAALLRQCADVGRSPAPEDLRQRLYTMLTEMEQILSDAF